MAKKIDPDVCPTCKKRNTTPLSGKGVHECHDCGSMYKDGKILDPGGFHSLPDQTFSERELTTVLAALRVFQEDIRSHKGMPHFLDVKPLSAGEIDDLCERLNCGD